MVHEDDQSRFTKKRHHVAKLAVVFFHRTTSRGNFDRKLVDVAGEKLIALDPMCLSTNNPKQSSDVTLENKQKIICVSVRTRSGLLCQNDVDFRCFQLSFSCRTLGGDLPPKNLPKISARFHASRR